MKLLYYNSYILPVFDYGCVVWGHGTNTYRNKISSIQKRAARIILAKPRGFTKADLFHDLQWLSFDDRCRYHTALLIYKTAHNLAPIYMNDILKFSENRYHTLRSQSKNNLALTYKPRTNYMLNSFRYFGFKVWNSIPSHIKNSTSIVSFKRNYKKYLLENVTY